MKEKKHNGVKKNANANADRLKPHRFKKGQSGNPAGRPKGSRNRSTILNELLQLPVLDSKGKKKINPLDKKDKHISYEKLIMIALIKKAAEGDVKAIREIQDTMYGKIKDETDVNFYQDEPIEIKITRTVHHANHPDKPSD